MWKRKEGYRKRWGEVKRKVEEKEEKAGNIKRERREKRREEAKTRQDYEGSGRCREGEERVWG